MIGKCDVLKSDVYRGYTQKISSQLIYRNWLIQITGSLILSIESVKTKVYVKLEYYVKNKVLRET